MLISFNPGMINFSALVVITMASSVWSTVLTSKGFGRARTSGMTDASFTRSGGEIAITGTDQLPQATFLLNKRSLLNCVRAGGTTEKDLRAIGQKALRMTEPTPNFRENLEVREQSAAQFRLLRNAMDDLHFPHDLSDADFARLSRIINGQKNSRSGPSRVDPSDAHSLPLRYAQLHAAYTTEEYANTLAAIFQQLQAAAGHQAQ